MAQKTDIKSSKKDLTQEIATYSRDITYPQFFGNMLSVLRNQDETLLTRGGGRGLKIYDDIERDSHAFAVLEKRKNAVIAREWAVDPASDDAMDVQIAAEIKVWLSNLKFDQLCKEALDATLKGYSVIEIIWAVRDGHLVPVKFYARDQRRFVFDTERQLRMLTFRDSIKGVDLPSKKFITHTFGGKDGTPYGLGLGSKLFWPVFFKRQDITFWLVFADKFGSPTAAGKYPPGTHRSEQKNLLEALDAIRQNSSIIFPQGMEADLLEASRSGAGDFYERMARYMDEQISEAVLGETLTTNIGQVGSQAAAQTHNDVRLEVAQADADLLSYTLNETLIKWCVELNWPEREPPTVWRNFTEPEDLHARVKRDVALDRMGWEMTPDKFIEVYGDGYQRKPTPEPATPARAPQPLPATTQAADTGGNDFAETEHERGMFKRFLSWLGFAEAGSTIEQQRTRNDDNQQALDAGAKELAENWQTLMSGRMEALQTLLDETQDLKLFRERLAEFLEADADPAIIQSVERATFAAHLAGRAGRTKDSNNNGG